MKVEYWHQGDKASGYQKPKPIQQSSRYAKQADQFGLMLVFLAILVSMAVGLVLYLSNKKYSGLPSSTRPTSSASVDFYQGNHVFSQKVAEEKAAKMSDQQHDAHDLYSITDDLEVSLKDQMASMTEKMEKMHLEKNIGEALPPVHDAGPKPELMTPLKPTKEKNFESPLEFNGALPKELQPGK